MSLICVSSASPSRSVCFIPRLPCSQEWPYSPIPPTLDGHSHWDQRCRPHPGHIPGWQIRSSRPEIEWFGSWIINSATTRVKVSELLLVKFLDLPWVSDLLGLDYSACSWILGALDPYELFTRAALKKFLQLVWSPNFFYSLFLSV